MTKIIDTQLALEQAAGNEALAKDLLAMLLAELPTTQSCLQLAITQNNFTGMWEHAHKLYGSTAYLGVPELRAASKQIEDAIKAADLNKVKDTFALVQSAINNLLQTAPTMLQLPWPLNGKI